MLGHVSGRNPTAGCHVAGVSGAVLMPTDESDEAGDAGAEAVGPWHVETAVGPVGRAEVGLAEGSTSDVGAITEVGEPERGEPASVPAFAFCAVRRLTSAA